MDVERSLEILFDDKNGIQIPVALAASYMFLKRTRDSFQSFADFTTGGGFSWSLAIVATAQDLKASDSAWKWVEKNAGKTFRYTCQDQIGDKFTGEATVRGLRLDVLRTPNLTVYRTVWHLTGEPTYIK